MSPHPVKKGIVDAPNGPVNGGLIPDAFLDAGKAPLVIARKRFQRGSNVAPRNPATGGSKHMIAVRRLGLRMAAERQMRPFAM
jgi:hypothetical protein